jgi:hypothetical protein
MARLNAGFKLVFSLLVGSVAYCEAAAPQLPTRTYSTDLPPSGGTLRAVPAGGDLQAAINAAVPGDTITLAAGARYVGNYYLPAKTGTGWITIRSNAPDSSLPAPGARITPSYASVMPKIVTRADSPALRTSGLAHHYRLIGLEFISEAPSVLSGIVDLGSASVSDVTQLPHDLIVDRCYIHGSGDTQQKNGIRINVTSSAIIDSYIDDIKSRDYEGHGIGAYNAEGPLKIENNFIAATGVNVLWGGAVDAIRRNVSDVTFRRNHVMKHRRWNPADPTYAGTFWMVKNLYEHKYGQRILIEGNTFENCWPSGTIADNAPQHGWAILFTVRSEGTSATWHTVSDITFRHNIVRNSNAGVSLYGGEGAGTHRIGFYNNVFTNIGRAWGNNVKTGYLLQPFTVTNITFDHNTAIQDGPITFAVGANEPGLVWTNNLTAHAGGFSGEGVGIGLPTLNRYFSVTPSWIFHHNAMTGGGASQASYPSGNFFPASWTDVQFMNLAGGNYRLATTSPYRLAGSDQKDLGADIDALEDVMRGSVTPTPPNSPPARPTNLR